jgi:lysozyme
MADIDRHIQRLKARAYRWPIPWEIVEDMGRREGCRLVSYLCPAKVWTIGWGETDGIVPGMRWTEDQADARFYQQVVIYAKKVEAMLDLQPNENQLGACTSLAYNIGLRSDKPKAGFYWSTVRRLHNAGDLDGAARAFQLFNKARNRMTGVLEVLPGLVSRRAAEAAMYLRPPEGAEHERMPQAVAGESSIAKSPIAQIGAGTASAGVLTAATSISDEVTETTGLLGAVKSLLGAVKDVVHQVADAVGIPPGTLLALVLIVGGIAVMRYRDRQRREGWA